MHNVSKSLSSLLLHYRSLILQLGDIEIDIEENSHSYLTQWSDATTEVWELSLVFWYFPRMQWRNVLRVPCLHLWKKENLLSRDKARNKWKSLKIILPKHNRIFIITIIAVKKCFANSSLRLGTYILGIILFNIQYWIWKHL